MNKFFSIFIMTIITSSSAFVYRDDVLRNNKQTFLGNRHLGDTNTPDEVLSKNVLRLATQLLSISSAKSRESSKYQIFSPIGISSVLSLLALGSKHSTKHELVSALGFNQVLDYHKNPLRIHQRFGLLIENLSKDIKVEQTRQLPLVNKIKRSYGEKQSSSNTLAPIPEHYQNLKNYHVFRRSSTPTIFKRSDPQARTDSGKIIFSHQDFKLNEELSPTQLTGHEISLANGLFIQDGVQLSADYKNAVKSFYRDNSDLVTLDFENDSDRARQFINEWAKRKTNDKIEQLIENGIETTTQMIIASALYFRSLWQTSFIESITREANFYPYGKRGTPVVVNMMATGGEFLFYDAAELGCHFVGLPFKDNLSTMFVIIPYDSDREKVLRLQQILTSDIIDEIISKRMQKKSMILNLPRMHLETTMHLKDILSQIGIKSLFDNKDSDLSGIITSIERKTLPKRKSHRTKHFRSTHAQRTNTQPIVFKYETQPTIIYEDAMAKLAKSWPEFRHTERQQQQIYRKVGKMSSSHLQSRASSKSTQKIFVDDILHKINLKINEQGIEGAATTVSHLPRSDFDDEFAVDAPFLFLIRHGQTKLPLFYGMVNDPSG